MIKNVLFDLDGTIVDSSRCIYYVYGQLFAELGIDRPKNMRRFIGPPTETALSGYVADKDLKKTSDRFREIYSTVDLNATNDLYDGIKEALIAVKNSGRKVYVATSKNEPVAKSLLKMKGIGHIFDGIYGSRYDYNPPRNQKSKIIEALIEDEGLNKEECILLGDTVYDVAGAKQSGIKVAIVNYGFGEIEDFVGEKIEFFADTTSDILTKIEEYDEQNNKNGTL